MQAMHMLRLQCIDNSDSADVTMTNRKPQCKWLKRQGTYTLELLRCPLLNLA